MTLRTFGCSITQGFALPDVVKPVLDSQGRPMTSLADVDVDWSDIHLYQPSEYAWPAVLARSLGLDVVNYARRGSCFQQIARQCVVNVRDIKPEDTVIVMWTYLSRLSLQWPARTAVPFCNIAHPDWGWRTVMLGFNKLFGVSKSTASSPDEDQLIQDYVEATAKNQLDPRGVYNRYYNNLVLQQTVSGLLENTGARVIHLSVETQPVLRQLEFARSDLEDSLRDPYTIPDPETWYTLDVDYDSAYTILDPSIPPAENDMHPSETHHRNFAEVIKARYFD